MLTGTPKQSRVTHALGNRGNIHDSCMETGKHLCFQNSIQSNSTEWAEKLCITRYGKMSQYLCPITALDTAATGVCVAEKSQTPAIPMERLVQNIHTCGRRGLLLLPSNLSSPLNNLELISHYLSWYVSKVSVNLE